MIWGTAVVVEVDPITLAYTGPFAGANVIELATLAAVAVSSLSALVAVVASVWESRSAARAQRGSVFLALSERYAQPGVHQAINELLAWKEAYPDDFVERQRQRVEQRTDEGVALDHARRLISTYFYDVLKLYELRILDKQLATQLINNFGAKVYVHICLPLGEPMYAQSQNIVLRFRRIDRDFGRRPL